MEKTRDKIALQVMEEINTRSIEGNRIYKGTMYDEVNDNVYDSLDRLQNAKEELMDALLYLTALQHRLKIEKDDTVG